MCRGGGTGRRTGLKILGLARGVRVRFPPSALIIKDLHSHFRFCEMPPNGALCLFLLYSGFNFLQDLLYKLATVGEDQFLNAAPGNPHNGLTPRLRIENIILTARQFPEYLIHSDYFVSNYCPRLLRKTCLMGRLQSAISCAPLADADADAIS